MSKLKHLFLLIMLPFYVAAFDNMAPEYAEGQFVQDNCQQGCYPFADQDCCQDEGMCWSRGWDLRFRVAAFTPQDHRFRRIYARWSPEYQLELSRQLWCQTYGWLNVGWYSHHGRSLGCCRHRTQIRILPVNFGLKQKFCVRDNINVYVGVGASYAWLRTHDHYRFVKQHRSLNSWGGIVKTGIEWCFCNNFFIDAFADYVYQPVSKPRRGARRVVTRSVNIGGWKLGGGIGYRY